MSTKASPTHTEQFTLPEVKVGGKDRLTCPHCGTAGLDNFVYLEDVQNFRKLIELKRKLLLIHSYYEVFDEGGKNPRLLCQTCDGECAIPEKLELDWE
jgi:ribosomal protein S27AE